MFRHDMNLVKLMKVVTLVNFKSKMTGGAPEVRSDKSLTLLTFDIRHQTKAMDQWTNGPMTNGPMDQWANWPMGQWTNGPMDQWTNGLMDQWTYVPMV